MDVEDRPVLIEIIRRRTYRSYSSDKDIQELSQQRAGIEVLVSFLSNRSYQAAAHVMQSSI